jgi:hypothetical protein
VIGSACLRSDGKSPWPRASGASSDRGYGHDFVPFGGLESNFKSRDCQVNPGNRLARFDQQVTQFLDPNTKNALGGCSDPNFDYGLILKVRPTQFPNRAWLMCAGFGEWGTSGARGTLRIAGRIYGRRQRDDPSRWYCLSVRNKTNRLSPLS